MEEATEKVTRHVTEVFPTDDYENRHLWREYILHALRLAQWNRGRDMEERYELYFSMAAFAS